MKLPIPSSQKESLQKACLQMDYDLQFHEVDDNLLNAYVFNRGRDLTETQAFWLGVWFQADLHQTVLEKHVEMTEPFKAAWRNTN